MYVSHAAFIAVWRKNYWAHTKLKESKQKANNSADVSVGKRLPQTECNKNVNERPDQG